MYKKITTALLIGVSLPSIVAAASGVFGDIVNDLVGIVNMLVPMLISLGIVLFFFNAGKGVFGQAKDSGQARAQLKDTLLWGIFIIFVMVSIWGILSMIGGEFDLMKRSFVG
jgi:ascorbate-specific PTS system EIIC-type component UlaA